LNKVGLSVLGLVALTACSHGEASEAGSQQSTRSVASVPAAITSKKVEPVIPILAGPYEPKDECAAVASAAEFHAALIQAIRNRNVEAFLALSDPEIKLDFGGGFGVDELGKRFREADGQALWDELDKLPALGCGFSAGQEGDEYLRMPRLFVQNFDGLDVFETYVVVGDRVPLRPDPETSATPVRLLSWVAVVIPAGTYDPDKPYQKVLASNGKLSGFVETARLRSIIDYRIMAERKGGEWQITAFIAGD
jgi:hypothetical protein